LSFDLPSEAYELGKRLKETEEELLNVLEKYNFRDEEMDKESRTKYKELNEMKEKLEGKIERIAFLRLPKRLKGKVLVYASCNCSLGRPLPNEYDMKLRSILLVKVKDAVTFEPEEFEESKVVTREEEKH
jgi:predicted membrane chloride channel (bestrophin family)